jgi:hypothetical protein
MSAESKSNQEGRRRARAVSTRVGAAPSGALVLLALAAVVAAAVWLVWLRPGSEPAAAQPKPAAPAEAYLDNPDGERSALADTGQRPLDTRYKPELTDPARFNGRGRLLVELQAPPDFNGPWTLSLAPAKALFGGDRALPRELQVLTGERRVTLEDVQLGGYEIRAKADGLQGIPEYVMMALPDDVDVIQPLRLVHLGELVGRVLDAEGAPAADFPVELQSPSGQVEQSVRSDATGHYRFERLADVEYKVAVGYAGAPLIVREVSFKAPSLTMPDLKLPPLAPLRVRVIDSEGRAIEGAVLTLSGLASGARSATTDRDGLAQLPHCVAGDCVLAVEAPEFVPSTQAVQFEPSAGGEREVRLRAR